MKGVCLKFYTYEVQKHHGKLLYEWLLEFARKKGLSGGSALRAIAGFGRGGMHQEHFFELASDVPIEVTFYLEKEKADALLKDLKTENLNLFYTTSEAEFGLLG